MRHLRESVIEPEQRVERGEPLVFEHSANPVRYCLMDSLTIAILVIWSSEQVNDLILRQVGATSGCSQRALKRTSGGVEKLH